MRPPLRHECGYVEFFSLDYGHVYALLLCLSLLLALASTLLLLAGTLRPCRLFWLYVFFLACNGFVSIQGNRGLFTRSSMVLLSGITRGAFSY